MIKNMILTLTLFVFVLTALVGCKEKDAEANASVTNDSVAAPTLRVPESTSDVVKSFTDVVESVTDTCKDVKASSVQTLNFNNLGFSINNLETPKYEDANGSIAVIMFMQGDYTEFVPNVNVITQQYGGNMDDYIVLTNQGYDLMGAKIVNMRRVGENEVYYEVTHFSSGLACTSYTKAILRDGCMYLSTGTALTTQWPDVKEQLCRCVDSLQ